MFKIFRDPAQTAFNEQVQIERWKSGQYEFVRKSEWGNLHDLYICEDDLQPGDIVVDSLSAKILSPFESVNGSWKVI